MAVESVDWDAQYEELRTMHSRLKRLQNETIGDVPHFNGRPRPLPVQYRNLLKGVSDALYQAERFVCKRME